MSRLARSVPGFSSLGVLEPGTLSPNIRLNRQQLPKDIVSSPVVGINSVGTGAIQARAVTSGLIALASIFSEHLAKHLQIKGQFRAASLRGIHMADDESYKVDGSFTFFAAATSGGAVTQQHDVTFADGIITAWTQT